MLHEDELDIDEALVRRLLDSQFPAYRGLSLRPLGASGSTNKLFRLGDELLVRLPRQPGGSDSIGKELRWGMPIGSALPVQTPQIIAIGEPAAGYPERWSITGWLDGALVRACGPNQAPTSDRSRMAADLAEVILTLRDVEVTPEASSDRHLRWYRGRPLAEFDADFRANLAACRELDDLELDLDQAERIWREALKLPGAYEVGPDRWYHGDLVAENLLIKDARLSAVLDFGSLSVGDPTIDLHGAWEILDDPAREVLLERLGVDEAEWLRGRAWALGIALGTFGYYWHTMPGRRMDRLAMARNVLASQD